LVNSREAPARPYNPIIDLLVLCTANQCRSPMAEVLLRRHLEQAGIDATVSSAGIYQGGIPATHHGVDAMAARGLDLSAHQSRQMDADMVRRADLVIAMARMHVREVAVLAPEALAKTFTLKELARDAAVVGERGRDEPLDAWLGRIAAGRVTRSLVGVGHDDEMDVADPVGRGRADYERTADLLDRLLAQVVDLAFPVHSRPEGQRA
jgi:protein-tyrosine-phosphatase